MAPMNYTFNNTLPPQHAQPVRNHYPTTDRTMDNHATTNLININGTLQTRNNLGPHYFVLEGGQQNEPIYDAVYQNVQD